MVEASLLHVNVLGKRDGRQVAHGDLIRGGVLDDLSAQVGTLDGAQVLRARYFRA